MIILPFAKGLTYVVVGLGKTGLSAAAALTASGAHVYVYDDSPEKQCLALRQGYIVAKLDQINWPTVQALVLSPGIPHHLPAPHPFAVGAKDNNVPIICDIDLLAQAYPNATYYGVTGTNGKSTVSALLYHQLKGLGLPVYLGGNIGHAVLAWGIQEVDPVFVLELSSYQLERVPHLKAGTAMWLNLTPDHLDRHGNLEDYCQAKQHLFTARVVPQKVIVGIDDAVSENLFTQLKLDNSKQCLPISLYKNLSNGINVVDGILWDEGNTVNLHSHPILKGRHNWQNIACVFGALKLNGLTFDHDHFLTFQGLSHRQEYCHTQGEIIYINDSKATNFESTATLLEAYDNLHLILGGVAKINGIKGIEKFHYKIKHCYLIGDSAANFAHYLRRHNMPFTLCSTLEVAVRQAAKKARIGDIVALSPACASTDQFQSFEHRGNVFKEIVNTLNKV